MRAQVYQHGRRFFNNDDSNDFLDWYDDPDEIAEHAKNMIAR
jgi:hypothetical protein